MPGVVTGKPLSIGGSAGRAEATGRGVLYTIEDAARRARVRVEGATVAVQGFGNVGEAAARLLHEAGAKVVAITDIGGGVYNADGLDVPALALRLRETGSLVGAPRHDADRQRDAVRARRGRPRPRRARGPDHGRERGRVRARILAEGANGPVDPSADPILHQLGVTVIPDILCNAGGVIVSYFEWAQNRSALAWTVDEVNERLRRQILTAADAVWQRATSERIPSRLAAHLIAVERVADATRVRGLYP